MVTGTYFLFEKIFSINFPSTFSFDLSIPIDRSHQASTRLEVVVFKKLGTFTAFQRLSLPKFGRYLLQIGGLVRRHFWDESARPESQTATIER